MNFKEKIPWTFIILISIGLILACSFLIFSEILDARKECNLIGGEYKFKIIQGHLCNGKSFVKYLSCGLGKDCNLIWVFEDSIGKQKINVSELIK